MAFGGIDAPDSTWQWCQ